MQELLERPPTSDTLALEVRTSVPAAVPMAAELERLGTCLLDRSRLLLFQGVSSLEPVYLEALLDPRIEFVASGDNDEAYVDVLCRAGVTDVEGEMASQALSFAGLPGVRCHAGTRYRFADPVSPALRPSVERLVGNPLIHQFHWSDEPFSPAGFDAETGVSAGVEAVEVRGLDDSALLSLSARHGLVLDLDEMHAVQEYFEALGRAPTDVELQSIALTWSEHCSHKTFKATIHLEYDGSIETIPGLLRSCIAEPTEQLNRLWVRSAFVDNAGIVAFDAEYDLAFKVETHNHPSALEPFGGAHTGVGGVIRDVLAVSAEPIANTDVLCFGPPDLPDGSVPPGVVHPRTTYREVVRGVADYGNNMGIPTVGGAVFFHEGYSANPLVFCGTLGILPSGSHSCRPQPGDAVVLLGGRTGRDGLHGATMSSVTLHRETVAASTVQIGAPIVEKGLRDVVPHLRDERLYHAITDCGAGGLCSAIGEMGADLGVEVDLALVPLKYLGLAPWEIWLSEAQERLVLSVSEANLDRLIELCRAYDAEATVLGVFRGDGALLLRHGTSVVGELDMAFMHEGRPAKNLHARWTTAQCTAYEPGDAPDANATLLALLSHPNIASKEEVIRRYDHEVGGATAIKPLVGNAGPSDAAVLKPLPDSAAGAVIAHGMNPLASRLDPYEMALLAVDEALRNLVAVGGSIDRAALLDNFCWGDVDDPDGLGGLVRAAQGCRDAALRYGAPFICGKDSLRNTSVDTGGRHSIPGTLLISALGVLPDIEQCVTMDLKSAGNAIYLLGCTGSQLGASHLLLLSGNETGELPQVRDETPDIMRRLSRAIDRGLVWSCHDLSEGGLAVAAAEMALAGSLGMALDLGHMPAETDATEALLFAETPGRFLVEVPLHHCAEFENALAGTPCASIGVVVGSPYVEIRRNGRPLVHLALHEIEAAWRTKV